MKQRLSPQEARERVAGGEAVLIDIRGFEEFAALRADGAKCIPLPDLERRVGEIPTDKVVLVICQSGNRSQMGAERLRAIGLPNVFDVEGGTAAWKAAGLPTIQQKGVMALERQVRLVAGLLVAVFSVLGFAVAPAFHYGAAFIGFMLTVTATLGICPMMAVLKLLPWNRVAANPAR